MDRIEARVLEFGYAFGRDLPPRPFERVEEDVEVLAFVDSDHDFHRQPLVANGFSDRLIAVFGDRGRHARSAVGTRNLPNDRSVEVDTIIRTRSGTA